MNDSTPACRQAHSARRQGLEVGRAVELKRGELTGIRGVLIGFRGEQAA